MSYFPNVPVPSSDSAGNVFASDVIGSKLDDEHGSSSFSKVFRTDAHAHSACMVYPSMSAGVNVTKNAAAWTLGAFAVIIPSNTISDSFDIHGINFDSVATNGIYEVVLYSGPDGSEVEICRTRITRTASSDIELEAAVQTPINAANSQIKAKLAGSNTSAAIVVMTVRYHLY